MSRRSGRRRSPQPSQQLRDSILARDAAGPVLPPPPRVEAEIMAARHLGLADLGRAIEISGGPEFANQPSAGTYAGILVGYRPGQISRNPSGPAPERATRILVLRYGTVTESVTVDLNAKITAHPHPATR